MNTYCDFVRTPDDKFVFCFFSSLAGKSQPILFLCNKSAILYNCHSSNFHKVSQVYQGSIEQHNTTFDQVGEEPFRFHNRGRFVRFGTVSGTLLQLQYIGSVFLKKCLTFIIHQSGDGVAAFRLYMQQKAPARSKIAKITGMLTAMAMCDNLFCCLSA